MNWSELFANHLGFCFLAAIFIVFIAGSILALRFKFQGRRSFYLQETEIRQFRKESEASEGDNNAPLSQKEYDTAMADGIRIRADSKVKLVTGVYEI